MYVCIWAAYVSLLLVCVLKSDLTIKIAMAPPMMKPAMTSDQWLRYSTTRLIPVRKARHMSPRESTGLASRVPLAFTEHVMYIWGKTEHSVIHLHPNHCVNAFHSSFIPCSRVGMFVWKRRFQFNCLNSGFHYNKLDANMHQLLWSVYVNIWMCLLLIHFHDLATLFHLSKT